MVSIAAYAFAYDYESSYIPSQGKPNSTAAWTVVPGAHQEQKVLTGSTYWSITADKICNDKNQISGSGKVNISVSGQNAHVQANRFVYNKTHTILEVQGDVKIFRKGMVTEGVAFKFDVSSPDYLITDPGITLTTPTTIERRE
jgi:lipopolysaccharide assembly outer membrane protein LptD (OstA)